MTIRRVPKFAVCVGLLTLLLGLEAVADAQGATISARMRRNPKLPAGTDAEGRVLLYTPKPVQVGSTHSHWDVSASPNLLMEPSISSDLRAFDLGLAPHALADMGWPLGASNIQISYIDPAGEGFNDPDLGEARRMALEAALEAWGAVLGSSVEISAEASFEEIQCDETGGTLARAGPRFVFMDFGAGEPDTWYSGALAEALTGLNLSAEDSGDPKDADLSITFNSSIDEECLQAGSRFYYGLDDEVPSGEISFVTVALHELAHGLGFVGLVHEDTGEFFRGTPDIFTRLTYDAKKKKYWDEMSVAQRKKSAKRTRLVSFDGESTATRADRLLKGRVVVEIGAPENLAGIYEVGTASFGPSLKRKGIRGELALVDDGSANPTFGCEPLTNAKQVAGKIAVIDRGECLFVIKTRNAQDAGAVGVIIVHNEKGFPPGLGGSDDSIEIPAVRIGKKDGRKIKRTLAD